MKNQIRPSACIRTISNNRAFSLVEMTVAMGIGTMLTLALTQYSLFTARTQQSQGLSNEFASTVAAVGQVLGNENLCSTTLQSQTITEGAALDHLNIQVAGSTVPQTLIRLGTLPSGLRINSMTVSNVQNLGAATATLVQQTFDLTISGSKQASQGSTQGHSVMNTGNNFVGNSLLSKTFKVAVWTGTTSNQVAKCVSSQDMAQGVPYVPTAYPSGGSCTGTAPTCGTTHSVQVVTDSNTPISTPSTTTTIQAVCCSTNVPVPFWTCPSSGWSC